jgi:hypothetical protein
MAENPYDSPQTPDENIVVASGVYKDRSTGLLLFGCLQILMGISMILMLPSAMVFPVFGSFLSGIPAAIVLLVLGLVLAALAYGSYRLQRAAWRGTLIVITLWALSTIVTFARGGLMGMYEQMNMPEEQLELIRQWGVANSAVSTTGTAVGALFVLGYILYVRKYFVADGNRESGER